MKRKLWKQLTAGLLTGAMLATSAAPGMMTASAAEITELGEVSVNPKLHYQTLKGWGSSLCWWGNVIGSWGDSDFNGNGRPDREEIAELAFSPEYLNLNIVRYNVGGGDKEDSSIKRVEGRVPGWTVDMTGTADGTGEFDADAFYAKETEDMNDAGQLWMLEQANAYRKDQGDIVNEVFSNSPPYYMTKSGSSTGGVNAVSNLKEDCYDDFAAYMARATRWIDNDLKEKFQTGVDFVEPMNEPDTNYWAYGSTKQEGCTFEPGAEMSNMILAMQTALQEEDLQDTVEITGTDETALDNAIKSFNKLSTDAKNSMTTIGAHTYSGTDEQRNTLRKLAASYDKDLWMSEVCKGGGKHDHDSMAESQTKSQSQGIMADLKYMQSSAWVAWLVADSEYECLKFDENWGLIHCVFESDGPVPDYHTNLVNSDGTAIDGIPGEGYWAVTKQFYTMMQYSKYLKAGYTMIDIGDDNMCAALSPDGSELVIVAQNFGTKRSTTVDLTDFAKAGTAVCYQTSDEANCEEVSREDVSGGILHMTLPEYSVSTYVIDVETDMENYMTAVEADVAKPAESGVAVSDLNKFSYTGTWSGQSSTEAGASASFTFDGTGSIIYGTKAENGALVSVTVDGEDQGTVDLTSDATKTKAVVYDTGVLEEGTHTVTMTVAEGQTDKVFALNMANVIHGTLEMTGGTKVRRIVPYDSVLVVYFDEVIGASEYTVKYGTSEDNLDKSVVTSDTRAIIRGIENDTNYYIQVLDDLDGASRVVSGKAGILDENILYFVNVGTDSLYTTASDETFGYCNSILDQAYDEDPVTGKNWGYVGTTNEAAYSDGDRWTSIRYSKEMNPLEYRFDVPAGTYNVTVAMLDPWKNSGRKTDILINGETKATELVPTSKTRRTYQATLAEDGTLSVIAQPSATNTAKQDAILSFIEITKGDADAISEVKADAIGTIKGIAPVFPETVKAVSAAGKEIDAPVTWASYSGADFEKSVDSVVTVTGTVTGTDITVEQPVVIVPCNAQYYIDCNRIGSEVHEAYHNAAGLRNDTADQAYEEGSWGYLDSYGAYDGSTPDGSGWYAGSNQSIQYNVPLNAGTYKVTFGFYDWWYGTPNRPTNLKAYIDGDLIEDWGTFAVNQRPIAAEEELTIDVDTVVTLSVEKSTGGDPILSWIRIVNTLDQTELTALVKQASSVEYGETPEENISAFLAAVAEGKEQLIKSDATQQSVDAAVQKLKAAMNGLGATDGEKNAVSELLTTAEQTDKSAYTEESIESLNKAMKDAQAALGKSYVSKKEIADTRKALQDAIDGLVKKTTSGGQNPGNSPDGSDQQNPGNGQNGGNQQNPGGGQGAATSVSAVKLSGSRYQIAAGKKVSLQAVVSPENASNKAVIWSSSNQKYATVNGRGVVTTKKAGIGKTVTITATAADGSGKKASAKIKIMKHAVKKITLKGGKSVKAGKKLKIKASVKTTGSKANKTLSWTSSNEKYAVVSSKGIVTAKKAGKGKTVKITAAATDGSGKKASVKIRIK